LTEREKRLDVESAARRLGIAPRTARDWIKTKLLSAVRKNPRNPRSPWLIRESAIEAVETEREST
jgi:predicted site-specific integrase-resolvase